MNLAIIHQFFMSRSINISNLFLKIRIDKDRKSSKSERQTVKRKSCEKYEIQELASWQARNLLAINRKPLIMSFGSPILVKNLGTMDRLLRVILAEICILIAFFWVAVDWQIPLYLIALVMLFQAATGTCGLYNMLGWNSCETIKRKDKNLKTAFVVVALVLAVAGSYASIVLTKNIFMDDLGKVNEPYSLALQYSGQGEINATLEQQARSGECLWLIPE